MTSRISSELLAQLTPVLGSMARLMASQQSITAVQLSTLLLGVGLEGDPAALEELQRWHRLLDNLRREPTAELRMATVEALCLRGLPEATARLAVSTVADAVVSSAETVTAAPLRLRVSVERLDFGTLQLGQSANASFKVEGGPGEVEVESDQVQVHPKRFGAQGGVVQVTVQPPRGENGGTLWTTLKISSARNTLEVPLVAEWRTQPDEGRAGTVAQEEQGRAESGRVTKSAPKRKIPKAKTASAHL